MKKLIHHCVYPILLAFLLLFWGCAPKSDLPAGTGEKAEVENNSVTLSPAAMETAGIRTGEVVFRSASLSRLAPGEIVFDPKLRASVTARTEGRIEKLSAYPGDRVRKGQVIGSLYSLEFLSLQAELFQASARANRQARDSSESAMTLKMIESVRNKLRRNGISEEDLSSIEKTGEPMDLLPIHAPISGTVIESAAIAGDHVELGANLFLIADLSVVWAEIHVFEKNLPDTRIGDEVLIRAAALPGKTYQGRIFQIGSTVDAKTRTVEGRVELSNPLGDLRPGLFIEAEIRGPKGPKALFVPDSAVLDFGNHRVVFVKTGDNVFTLRDIVTGRDEPGFVEVVSGLSDKEIVATEGSFFLKSELLKSSLGEE
jgi:membrane fusion protein, copper/silver efflux system